jgi:hypothetical protein
MKQTLLLLFILFSLFAFSQKAPKEYLDLIYKAESLFLQKNYKASALAYSAAFKAGKYKIYSFDFYNAGCAWALAGNPDSAFVNLDRIVSPGVYKDYNHITNDFDLLSLRQDKRWLPLIKKVLKNNNKK